MLKEPNQERRGGLDNQFELCLAEMKKLDPNRMVESVYRLFVTVERMDLAEVVAAKRTLDLFRSLTQVDESGTKILDTIDKALECRGTIHYANPAIPFHDKYHPIISAFGRGKCGNMSLA